MIKFSSDVDLKILLLFSRKNRDETDWHTFHGSLCEFLEGCRPRRPGRFPRPRGRGPSMTASAPDPQTTALSPQASL